MTTAEAPRIAFMIGTGRCGSTLLHEILARHTDIGFLSNVDDNLKHGPARSSWNSAIYDRVPPALTRKGRLRFAPSEGYRALEAQVSGMIVEPPRDLIAQDATPWMAARFRRFFQDRAQAQGRAVFLHKFTGWPRTGFIDAVFPEARYINVIRDGRAVANSLLQMPWWGGYQGPERWGYGPLPAAYQREWDDHDRSFPALAGLCWKLLMDAYDTARENVDPQRWLDVRYEDVLARPRDRFAKMLEFLELEWSPQFEAHLGRQRLTSTRTDAYRRDLDDASVAALEQILDEPLRRLGYLPLTGDAGGEAAAPESVHDNHSDLQEQAD